jgi:putative ABC transport system permease protein
LNIAFRGIVERQMLQDYKLGIRMLRKYPSLTLAGGLALAIAIGFGAGWYDLASKLLFPTIPLPEGDRIVLIETQNILTNEPEPRVVRDFLEWRRELRTIGELGAYRTDVRNLVVSGASPQPIQIAELTTAAFGAARVPPLLGRAFLDSDQIPGAPSVVLIGYDVWQRSLGGRQDVIGSIVRLGNARATVIGVMPRGFAYPVNHDAWTPLQLRASYDALEGGAINVIGRLAPGVTWEQASAELQVSGERVAAAFPTTYEHLRPRLSRLGGSADMASIAQLALRYVPALLVLVLACMTVGTLIYARTAIREGEIAVRSALGASRARIVGQLFVEALVLTAIAATVGLVAADRTLRWGIEGAYSDSGGAPFWMTTGLNVTTILYAGGLALASAAMLSFLPALRATRTRAQSHLANLGSSSATLRFGRVWTTAMIAQVAVTAMAIPVALESASEATRNVRIRSAFPGREYVAARLDLDRSAGDDATSAFEARRAQAYSELERRIAQEPGVVAITFADRAPGSVPSRDRAAAIETTPGAGPAFDYGFRVSAVGRGFFEAVERPIVAGRAFNGGDFSGSARTAIVNEAFAREFLRRGGTASPLGARLRYAARSRAAPPEPWFEIVGVVRDLGLDPDDEGNEAPYVFHAAPAGTAPVMSVHVRGNAAALVARLPTVAADVDAALHVDEVRTLGEWIHQRDLSVIVPVTALAAATGLVLLLSAMSIFSLMSVSVSRRTREIGLRSALGANPRHLLAGILSRAMVLMASGAAAGACVVLLFVANGAGPTGRPGDDVVLFVGWLALTAAVMVAAGVLACVEPARRALKINPMEALRDA